MAQVLDYMAPLREEPDKKYTDGSRCSFHIRESSADRQTLDSPVIPFRHGDTHRWRLGAQFLLFLCICRKRSVPGRHSCL